MIQQRNLLLTYAAGSRLAKVDFVVGNEGNKFFFPFFKETEKINKIFAFDKLETLPLCSRTKENCVHFHATYNPIMSREFFWVISFFLRPPFPPRFPFFSIFRSSLSSAYDLIHIFASAPGQVY